MGDPPSTDVIYEVLGEFLCIVDNMLSFLLRSVKGTVWRELRGVKSGIDQRCSFKDVLLDLLVIIFQPPSVQKHKTVKRYLKGII